MNKDEFTVTNDWSNSDNLSQKATKLGKKYKDKLSLIDKKNRSTLSEGRNYGFSTAMAKREDGNLVTVCPITACKDFISDVIYTEKTGKPYSIYGLSYSKQNIFNDGVGYMVFGIEKQGRELSEYTNYKRDYETLASNYENLQKFINWFEKEFKLESFTEIKQIGENRYVAVFPLFWSEGTYLISLYGLLLRVGMFYKDGDIITYLKNFKNDSGDAMMINTVMNKIEKMLKGEIPKQDLNSCYSPHSTGIQGYSF
jgi:hypothetical protein